MARYQVTKRTFQSLVNAVKNFIESKGEGEDFDFEDEDVVESLEEALREVVSVEGDDDV